MAARTPVEILQDEAFCSICLEIFQDPVSIHCGHSFCRSCISETWEGLTTNFFCPQCRKTVSQKRLHPSRELANISEAAKRLNLQRDREVERGENLCEKHQESLKLFCKDEKRLICVVCDRSQVHRDHSVVPMEEAAQEFKKQIQTHLHLLQSEQEALQSSVKDRQNRIKDHSERTEAAKQKVVRTYRKMHEFLEKEETSLLAQMEKLDTDIKKAHEEILQRLLEETTSLGTLIGEMERTYQQTDWQLLKDIRTTLTRSKRESFSHSPDISLELEKKFSGFTEEFADIKELLEKFQDFLEFEVSMTSDARRGPNQVRRMGRERKSHLSLKSTAMSLTLDPPPAQMTLDPETANPRLYLSEDCKLLWWEMCEQDLPYNPRRFKSGPFVLGWRGFTSGCHCWDVEVHREGVWAIGVAKESVPRDLVFFLNRYNGVWALRHYLNQYEALTSLNVTPLTLRIVPKRIRVRLDYEGGRVGFLDAERKEQIFAFLPTSFQGERVFPWFMVIGDAQLKLFP